MRLMIKQRVFAWTDTYDIYDEWGNKKYFVKSEAFRLTHQVHVYDLAGNEIGLVSQRLFTFLPTFDISVGGRPCGSIRKEFTFFKPSYSIEYGDGSVMEIFFHGITMLQLEAGWWQI